MNRLVTLTFLLVFPLISVSAVPTAEDFAGRIDLSVPQSAGFALLGVTPDKVIDPQSGQEFGLALLNGLDENGNFQSGFALETRPFIWGDDEYITEPTVKDRALSGFKFSFAATTGLEDEDKANRYGVGVNWSYQFNDPLFDPSYIACWKAAGDAIVPRIPNPNDTTTDEQKITALRSAVIACQEKHFSWTTSAIGVGAAYHKAVEDELNIDDSGYGLWLTGSIALNKQAELAGHFRYVDNQLSVVEGSLAQADKKIVAARFRYGGKSIRGILESSWNEEETSTVDDEYTLVSVGAEFKIAKDLWFRVAYGDSFGSSGKEDAFFSGQLRFGYGSESLASF